VLEMSQIQHRAECLTLQFGHYANLTGVNFLNSALLELETNSDISVPEVFFRIRQNSNSPRTLMFDMKGSFESLASRESLEPNECKQVERIDKDVFSQALADPFSKSLNYLNMNKERNTFELNNFTFSTDSFLRFANGCETLRDSNQKEESFDKFRYMVEECDRFRGIVTLVESGTSFGGVASEFLLDVRDEFPSIPIISFGLHGNYHSYFERTSSGGLHALGEMRIHSQIRLNELLSLNELSSLSSIYVPMEINPSLFSSEEFTFDDLNLFNSSFYLGTAINTALLPFRLSDLSTSFEVHELVDTLRISIHSNIATLSSTSPLSFPVSTSSNAKSMMEKLHTLHSNRWIYPLSPLLPLKGNDISPLAEAAVFRGVSSCAEWREMAESNLFYGSRNYSRRISSISSLPLTARLPFSSSSTDIVSIISQRQPESSLLISTASVSLMQTTKAIFPKLKSLVDHFCSLEKSVLLSEFETVQDINEASNHLLSITDQYDPCMMAS